MCCAEAGDPISTDNNVAAPKNRVLVILLLLIIDPSTWAVGEQDRHFGHNIPGRDRSADHASAIRVVAGTRTLDWSSDGRAPQAQTENIENNPMQSSRQDA
jgi:hypothetical protein